MKVLPYLLLLLVFACVIGGGVYCLVLARRDRRAADPVARAREAGRRDVLDGWASWARGRPVSWDALGRGSRVAVIGQAQARGGSFDAAAAMTSEEYRLHESPVVRAAYLSAAREAGREIQHAVIGSRLAERAAVEQARRVTAEIDALHETDPGGSIVWDRRFGD